MNQGGKKIPRGVKVWPVSTGTLKSELYGWLSLNRPTIESGENFPIGYCHHPQLDEEFFRQLTAEQLVKRVMRTGYERPEWQKTRDRNEALDTWIYARAASIVLGIDRFSEKHWQKLELDVGYQERGANPLQVERPAVAPTPPSTPRPSIQPRPNQPGRPEYRDVARNQNGGPVWFSVWFAPARIQNTRPNTQPSTKKNTNSDTASGFETSRHR